MMMSLKKKNKKKKQARSNNKAKKKPKNRQTNIMKILKNSRIQKHMKIVKAVQRLFEIF